MQLKVGAAKRIITPRAGLPMGGYARRTSVAVGTSDELYCRVLVCDDGPTTLVLVVCDLLYPSRALTDLVRDQLSQTLSVPLGHVLVCATHTHCGPSDLAAPAGAELRAQIADQILDAAVAARSAQVPARLAVSRRAVPGVSAHRRSAAGPADDTALVVAAYSSHAPEPIATIVNFACHATILEHDTVDYSADFPGAVCDTLESLVGGVGIYLQGCAGDVNPVYTRHDIGECRRVGAMLGAAGAQAALDGLGLVSGLRTINPSWDEELDASERSGTRLVPLGPLGAAQQFVPGVPALPPDVTDVEGEPVRDRAARRSLRWIAELRAGGNLFGSCDVPADDLATLEVQHLRLGAGLDLVALPGEPFLATGRAIRADRDGAVLLAGYANQSAGYLPPADEYAGLGYEIGCSQYAPGTAEAVESAARDLLAAAARTGDGLPPPAFS